MKKLLIIAVAFNLTLLLSAQENALPVGWEELTSPNFKQAVKQSQGVCILPMGVVEKHGPHLPLGTDVFTAREVSRRAAQKNYCVVYPPYYIGQIFEAKHQPGTIAYSPELIYKMLEETCAEIARNGMKKIILVNSHGGNTYFLQYFCQTQLAKSKDYAVYLYTPSVDAETQKQIASLRKSTAGGHADEIESSTMVAIRPDLTKIDKATSESGKDQGRLNLENALTGIWWYDKYPNHYAGDAKDANKELGEVKLKQWSDQLAEVVKTVKEDRTTLRLQEEFFKESNSPLETIVH